MDRMKMYQRNKSNISVCNTPLSTTLLFATMVITAPATAFAFVKVPVMLGYTSSFDTAHFRASWAPDCTTYEIPFAKRPGFIPSSPLSMKDHTISMDRSKFLSLSTSAILGATLASPVKPAIASSGVSTNFIDIPVELGMDGGVLDIRQRFGMPKQSKEDSQGGGDRQGTYVWPASTDLARYLLSREGIATVRGCRVLELGSGTAIAGMSAMMAGAATVCLTDGSPEVLAVTKDNVARNADNIVAARSRVALRSPTETLVGMGPEALVEEKAVRIERLRWGNRGDIDKMLTPGAGASVTRMGYDVVLGAEITYLSASLDPLLCTMRDLITGPHAGAGRAERAPMGILTYTPELVAFDGGGVAELHQKAAAHGLNVQLLPPPPGADEPDTQIIALKAANLI